MAKKIFLKSAAPSDTIQEYSNTHSLLDNPTSPPRLAPRPVAIHVGPPRVGRSRLPEFGSRQGRQVFNVAVLSPWAALHRTQPGLCRLRSWTCKIANTMPANCLRPMAFPFVHRRGQNSSSRRPDATSWRKTTCKRPLGPNRPKNRIMSSARCFSTYDAADKTSAPNQGAQAEPHEQHEPLDQHERLAPLTPRSAAERPAAAAVICPSGAGTARRVSRPQSPVQRHAGRTAPRAPRRP